MAYESDFTRSLRKKKNKPYESDFTKSLQKGTYFKQKEERKIIMPPVISKPKVEPQKD